MHRGIVLVLFFVACRTTPSVPPEAVDEVTIKYAWPTPAKARVNEVRALTLGGQTTKSEIEYTLVKTKIDQKESFNLVAPKIISFKGKAIVSEEQRKEVRPLEANFEIPAIELSTSGEVTSVDVAGAIETMLNVIDSEKPLGDFREQMRKSLDTPQMRATMRESVDDFWGALCKHYEGEYEVGVTQKFTFEGGEGTRELTSLNDRLATIVYKTRSKTNYSVGPDDTKTITSLVVLDVNTCLPQSLDFSRTYGNAQAKVFQKSVHRFDWTKP